MKKAKKERTKRRYTAIRKDYESLTSVKCDNVRKYSEEYVLNKLAKNHFLSVKTIEDIISYRV